MRDLRSNKRKSDGKEIAEMQEPAKRQTRSFIKQQEAVGPLSGPTTDTAQTQAFLASLETKQGRLFSGGNENLARDSSSRSLERREESQLSEEDQAHLNTIKKLSKLALKGREKLTFFQPILVYRESQQPDQEMTQKALDRWKEFSQSSEGHIAWEHLTNDAFWRAVSAYKTLTQDKHYEDLFKDLKQKDKETINEAFGKIQWEDLEKVINQDIPVWKDQSEEKGKKLRAHLVRTTYHLRNLKIYSKLSEYNPTMYENTLKGNLMQFVADAYAKGRSRSILIHTLSKILNQGDLQRIHTILEVNNLIEPGQKESTESQEASTSSGKRREESFSEKGSIQKQETTFLQFDNVENIDLSSIANAKSHIWKSKKYQEMEDKGVYVFALESLKNIGNNLKLNTNKNGAEIQKELKNLCELAIEEIVIRSACEKICLKQNITILHDNVDNVENIDISSINGAIKHLYDLNWRKEQKIKDHKSKTEIAGTKSAIKSLRNIQGKLRLDSNKKNIDIKEELNILRELAKKFPLIKTACEKIYFIKENNILQFDTIENIDISSIRNAREHIHKNDLYRSLKKSEQDKDANEQSEKYRCYLLALDQLRNLKCKILNKDWSDAEESLKTLRELAKRSKVIETACKKIKIK